MLIITTASHLSSNTKILRKMILSGSDVLRFNFSYGTIEEKINRIEEARDIIYELNAHTKILIDLPNPKIRLGGFPIKNIYVREGDKIRLQSANYVDEVKDTIPVQCGRIGDILYPEQTIIIDEGEVTMKVINIYSPYLVECAVMNSGNILPYKGLNWANQNLNQKDKMEYIENNLLPKLVAADPDFLACPFVNDGETARQYKQAIEKTKWSDNKIPKIIFKIETKEAIENIKDILNLADIILFERGNLGLHAPFEKIGIYQKYITQICKNNNKKIFVSTQILESTIHNYIPQRSEILDLTNIVLDNIDGIVLCHETGISMRPAYSISIAKKIIDQAEQYKAKIRDTNTNNVYENH